MCAFPRCKCVYASTDGIRKHSNKKHKKWISKLKPSEFSINLNFDFDELMTQEEYNFFFMPETIFDHALGID
jgi:hypothetical protein